MFRLYLYVYTELMCGSEDQRFGGYLDNQKAYGTRKHEGNTQIDSGTSENHLMGGY